LLDENLRLSDLDFLMKAGVEIVRSDRAVSVEFSLGLCKGLFVFFLDTSSVRSGFMINVQIYVNAVLTRSTNLACVGKE
jgi:hypothetical protein